MTPSPQLAFHIDGKARWRCPVCDLIFRDHSMEYRHRIRKHHWGNFRCPICGDRDVWSARTVLDHMQAKHQSQGCNSIDILG